MAAGSARGTAWQDGARHALEYAIAASLALHALALLSLPSLPWRAERALPVEPPLEARLVSQQPVAVHPPPLPAPVLKQVPPPTPKPRPAPRPVAKKAPPAPKRAHRPVPKRVHESVRQPVLEAAPAAAPESAPEPPAPEPVVAAPRVPSPPVVVPAPARATAPAVRAAPPPDVGSLVASYRAEIISQARRYKRYPRFARDNGWEGKVDVRMEIGADGSIASLRVARGTGYSILDQQALEMVRRAKPDASIPQGLRGKAFGIDVPVIFSLRDADG